MDSTDFFVTAPAPVSRFEAPPVAPAPAVAAAPAPASSRWRATATTFGPAVKVPATLVVLLLALWGPVHSLLSHSAAPADTGSGTVLENQVANAVGGGLVPSQQTHAVVQKVSTLVGQGAHAVSTATSAFTWSWHVLAAAVLLYFVWQPGRRLVRR